MIKDIYVVWHDNGVAGQHGYTEHEDNITKEELIKQYKDLGITVYAIDKVQVPIDY